MLDFFEELRMDGEVFLVSRRKPCIMSGASATPALLGMTCRMASSFWRRLTFAADAPPKISYRYYLVHGRLAPDLLCATRRVWSNSWLA